MIDPDELFFYQLDPFYHFKHASLVLHCETPNRLRMTDAREDFLSSPENIFKNIEKVRNSSIRFTRYHQAETLLTVILGSYPHGPVVYISKNPKIRLREIAGEIAARRVPVGFEITKNGGQKTTFEEWLSYKVTGYLAPPDAQTINEVIDFIVLESTFFNNSNAFMAYKHGCLVSDKHPRITVEITPGNWIDLLNMSNSVGWMNCEIKSGRISALSFGVEELDAQNDASIIFLCGIIVAAIRDRMLARFEKKENPSLHLPTNMSIKSQIPQNYKMRIA